MVNSCKVGQGKYEYSLHSAEISETRIAPSKPRLLSLWSRGRDLDFLKVVSVVEDMNRQFKY